MSKIIYKYLNFCRRYAIDVQKIENEFDWKVDENFDSGIWRNIMGYKLVDFKTLGDDRGSLIALEENYNTPFEISRVYYIFDTKEGVRRGYHAHLDLKQMAICVKGSCIFVLDDGNSKEEIRLDSPNQGLLIEGLIWREMYNFSPDCVLLVLASEHYDEVDYIRDYDKFLEEVNK